MSILKTFTARRRNLLNPPAEIADIERFLSRFSASLDDIREIFKSFNGEIGTGAWLSGYSLYSIDCADEAYDALNYDVDEEDEFIDVLPFFLPIIGTEEKSDIGLVFSGQSEFAGKVIEFHTETGRIRIWANSIEEFIEAFLRLSLEFNKDPSINAYEPFLFGNAEMDFLSSFGVEFNRHWIEPS